MVSENTKKRYQEIVKLRKKGWVYRRIAEHMNVPLSTVISWVRRVEKHDGQDTTESSE